jgi:hypothetical protein
MGKWQPEDMSCFLYSNFICQAKVVLRFREDRVCMFLTLIGDKKIMIIGTNAVYASGDDESYTSHFFQTVAGSLVQRSSPSGLDTLALDRKWTGGWEMSSVWWFSVSVLSDRAEFIKGKGFISTLHRYFTLICTGCGWKGQVLWIWIRSGRRHCVRSGSAFNSCQLVASSTKCKTML